MAGAGGHCPQINSSMTGCHKNSEGIVISGVAIEDDR
jgi:hypothetical protein